jgi:hypothetical protein
MLCFLNKIRAFYDIIFKFLIIIYETNIHNCSKKLHINIQRD